MGDAVHDPNLRFFFGVGWEHGDVESADARHLEPAELEEITARLLGEAGRFVGAVDRDRMTIQAYNEGDGVIRIETPAPAKGGSFCRDVDGASARAQFRTLQAPLSSQIETLKLEFEPW